MNTRAADELHALRARAFGPHADIDGDDLALRRLQELEALASEQRQFETERPDAAPLVRDEVTVADTAEIPSTPENVDSTHSAPAAPSPRSTKRVAMWWVGSLLMAVIATATVTTVVSQKAQEDPRQVATLGVDLSAQYPRFLGLQNQDGRVFSTFYGLQPVASTGGWMGGPDSQCLGVLDAATVVADADSYSGNLPFGCAAGGFPATVQVKVTAESPAGLRAAFPEGSALQFVLDGSEVSVLSDLVQ